MELQNKENIYFLKLMIFFKRENQETEVKQRNSIHELIKR